jgi:hypothetical protein
LRARFVASFGDFPGLFLICFLLAMLSYAEMAVSWARLASDGVHPRPVEAFCRDDRLLARFSP